MSDTKLKDKVALVTGSSRGLGRALALALAEAGADIVVTYHSQAEAAAETVQGVEALGRRSIALQVDVSRGEAVQYMVETALERFERIDILINNAGSFPIKPFTQLTEGDWDKVMALDLKGVFLCCKAVFPAMRRQREGRIINVTSAAGLVGALGMVPYSAAKAGVIGLTKALARELAPFHITVNAVAPGIIATETTERTFSPGMLDIYTRYQVPLGRLGQPEEVTGLVVFLASAEARYITGQVYAVDGGFTMQ